MRNFLGYYSHCELYSLRVWISDLWTRNDSFTLRNYWGPWGAFVYMACIYPYLLLLEIKTVLEIATKTFKIFNLKISVLHVDI